MRGIDFYNLSLKSHKQHSYLHAFSRVLGQGVFLRGQENARLRKQLIKLFGRYVTLVASGHDALLLSLQSLHLKSSDEIIIPANAYPTAFAVALAGSKIKLADVTFDGQLSAQSITTALTKHTKAIVMVHMYGATGDIDAIRDVCTKNAIYLIEDCAQAFGTTYKNKPVGTFGDIGCFSFYPTKNLGGFGDGGGIHVKQKTLYDEINKRTLYGETKRYQSTLLAGHSNLPELQAAALTISLKSAPKEFLRRKMVAQWYKKALRPLSPNIQTLSSDAHSNPTPHLFVIRAKKRNALQKYLHAHKIPTFIHYPIPIYKVPTFAYLKTVNETFPTTESLTQEIISLPFHGNMRKSDVLKIVSIITNFYTSI